MLVNMNYVKKTLWEICEMVSILSQYTIMKLYNKIGYEY